jgi:isopentenyl phosphate kinase
MPNPNESELVFLKLGGSLITDKMTPRTPRIEVIERIAREIHQARRENPALKILLGHGSGSFGHTSGQKYRTREGVYTEQEWLGFAEVMADAASLNNLVMDALTASGLPAVVFPPSSSIVSAQRLIQSWNLAPIQIALEKGLLPVVYGDVVFDDLIGGTILSTEDLFFYLAQFLKPSRILLAGQDPGVWMDFPDCTRLYEQIRPADRAKIGRNVSRSRAPDVTGGMGDKVAQMLDLVEADPDLECAIFSGSQPGAVAAALAGEKIGTLIRE